jgi:hypothetical protein
MRLTVQLAPDREALGSFYQGADAQISGAAARQHKRRKIVYKTMAIRYFARHDSEL